MCLVPHTIGGFSDLITQLSEQDVVLQIVIRSSVCTTYFTCLLQNSCLAKMCMSEILTSSAHK